MTLERTENVLRITSLPVEQMAVLSLGLALLPEEKEVLTALLEGKRVELLEEGLEYKAYRKSAPMGVYRKFVSLERELRELGVVVIRNRRG